MNSSGAYVVNWKDFAQSLEGNINVEINGDLNVDFKPVQDVLEKYLPEIKALIEAIANGQVKQGMCGIRGEHLSITQPGEWDISPNTNKSIALTGITYWQSKFSSLDTYDLLIVGGGGYITLFEGLHPKDFAETKKVSPAIPIPAGYSAVVRVHHGAETAVDICIDFEYVELEE